jgi:glycerophosphoryl diester phosphodiesterase
MNEKNVETPGRIDPIFKLQTPLLFAHRGGAKEAPESTVAAFKHAIENHADILELDVQLTKDRKIVVWHGPKLDNVKIKGQYASKFMRSIMRKRKIWHYNFDEELRDRAWVGHPQIKAEKQIEHIPEKEDRKLLLLEEFLDFLKTLGGEKKIPLNIELKGKTLPLIGNNLFLEKDENKKRYLINRFKKILDLIGNGRKIIVASASEKVLIEFDKINKGASIYPTNVSFNEQMRYSKYMALWYARLFGPLLKVFSLGKKRKVSLENNAFETSYVLVTENLVKKVHKEKGSIYIFVTKFGPIKGIVDRHENEKTLKDAIHALLKTGVDGLMTDYPQKIGKIIRNGKSNSDV